MRTIVVPQPRNESLMRQLESLYRTLSDANRNEQVIFDLSHLDWVCPLLLLPLAVHIATTRSQFVANERLNPYLSTIAFPHGTRTISRLQASRTYTPIGILDRTTPKESEELEHCFVEMIYKALEHTDEVKNALYYPLLELVGNIYEHSKRNQGFVFGQYYPTKQYVDMCIVDDGRGLVGSYRDELGLTLTPQEAIAQALQGVSTKGEERGRGLRTSKAVVCEALHGSFVILTGNAVFVARGDQQQQAQLANFDWPGVIVAYRIPRPTTAVDIYPYV